MKTKKIGLAMLGLSLASVQAFAVVDIADSSVDVQVSVRNGYAMLADFNMATFGQIADPNAYPYIIALTADEQAWSLTSRQNLVKERANAVCQTVGLVGAADGYSDGSSGSGDFATHLSLHNDRARSRLIKINTDELSYTKATGPQPWTYDKYFSQIPCKLLTLTGRTVTPDYLFKLRGFVVKDYHIKGMTGGMNVIAISKNELITLSENARDALIANRATQVCKQLFAKLGNVATSRVRSDAISLLLRGGLSRDVMYHVMTSSSLPEDQTNDYIFGAIVCRDN